MPRQRDKVAHGWRAARKGNVHDAERLYREAIAEGDSYGYNNLAQLLIEDGRLAEGERLFREGVKAGDALAAKNLALFLLEEGRDIDAEGAIEVARRMGRPLTPKDLAEARAYGSENRNTR